MHFNASIDSRALKLQVLINLYKKNQLFSSNPQLEKICVIANVYVSTIIIP